MMPIAFSRSHALENGLKTYLNGKPCPYGHFEKRYTNTGECIKCRGSRRLEWYYKNRSHAQKVHKEWIEKNKENLKNKRRIEKINNPEKVREEYRKSYYRNKDNCKKWSALWKKNNPDKVRIHSNRQTVLKKNAEGFFTENDVKNLREQYQGRCAYYEICKGDTNVKGNEIIEHMTPLSRGGTNWPNNLQLTCRSCNSSKRSKTAEEFVLYLRRKHKV